MFDRESPEIIWVSPDVNTDEEYGTWEQPFSSIEIGLKHLQPGYTLVLKNGVYEGNVTIELSGTARMPVRITADDDAVVVISKGCWFFYDTSDLIISNLTFEDAPHGAVSVIGKCCRNRFASLKFNRCGTAGKSSCTMYFGGSGGVNNIVEDCSFDGTDELLSISDGTSIALMISEGDLDNGAPVKNHIIRKNSFNKYGYGILVGSSNSSVNQYGHVIEYNVVNGCATEGICVKCGDTQVRGNRVEHCVKNSIRIAAGSGSVIDSNRIVDCGNGIRVNGAGHSVENNCVVRVKSAAVLASGQSDIDIVEASNLFIENNTFVNCGLLDSDPQKSFSGIVAEAGTSCIIQSNLVYGIGNPLVIAPAQLAGSENAESSSPARSQCLVNNNIVSGANVSCKGFEIAKVDFPVSNDNFENSSGYGASGWVLTPQTFDPEVDKFDDEVDYIEASAIDDESGELIIPGESESHEFMDRLYGQIASGDDFSIDEEK